MLGPTLVGDQIVQVGEPDKKRPLAAPGVMKAFHGEQFPLDGVVSLVQQGAHHRHLGIFKDRIPARFLLLKPLSYACAVGHPGCVRDVVREAPQPLAQCKDAQAFALACSVPQGVELAAERLTEWGRNRREFLRELRVFCPAPRKGIFQQSGLMGEEVR